MNIETNHPGLIYGITFLLSIIIATSLQIYLGIKKGYPVISWLLLLLVGKLLFFSGLQIINFSESDWMYVIQHASFPHTYSRSLIGGFISFLFVYAIGRYFLKFDNRFLDVFTVPLLIGLAIQRIGCLFVGCCSGLVSNMPWAITYNSSSLVYQNQIQQGLITENQVHSLAVHPVALYYIAASFIILGLHVALKKYRKAPGSSLFFAGMLFFFFRFMIEFFVNPELENVGTQIVFHLKAVQWFSLLASFYFLWLFVRNENRYRKISFNPTPIRENQLKNLLLVSLSMILIWLGRNFFNSLELLILNGLCFILLTIITIKMYSRISLKGYRFVPIMLLLGFIVLTSQNVIEKKDSSVWKKSSFIGLGHSFGEYETVHSTGCSSIKYQQKEQISAVFYGIKKTNTSLIDRNNEYGIALTVGDNSNKRLDMDPTLMDKGNAEILGINPYASFNWHYLGLGVGAGIGSFNYGDRPKRQFLMPELSLRLGPKSLFYISGNLNYNTPISSHYPLFDFRIGSGLGNAEKFDINFGAGTMSNEMLILFSSRFPIKEKFSVGTSLGYFDSYNYFAAFELRYQFH